MGKTYFMHFLVQTQLWRLCICVSLFSRVPPSAHRLQLQLGHCTNCSFQKIANLRCCSLFIFTPLPPLPAPWKIYIFEIMSVFNYQNQYKNSSMLLKAKSRFIMHCEFKYRFLPSSYIIKIFFKVNIKARGIRTDTA